MNSDDLKKFRDALEDMALCTAEGARFIILTAIDSGCRISEILGLQPLSPALGRGAAVTWWIPKPLPASASERSAP